MELKQNDIVLRGFRKTDSVRLAELANNEKISQNLRDGFPHPYSLKDAEYFIENCLNQHPSTFFAIEFNGEYVGNISLLIGKDVYRRSAEIGYCIGEPYWNKGIATNAVNMICEHRFKNLGIVRIHTGIFKYNTASMRVLEKCGFEKEGVFKKSIFKKGKLWNEVRYSKINPDY
jgi:[ribosomal protein S5]-alanine N-acetyltransferase